MSRLNSIMMFIFPVSDLKNHFWINLVQKLKDVWYNKTCRWNFFKFSFFFFKLFILGKYIKIRFKDRVSPCYFLSSRGQKIINIIKIEQTRLFLFTFLLFFMVFLAQKLIYTLNLWFNFVLGSFFEQDHLLSLFILGV